eukprot:gnl/TRDRNA2_/TRDRNA2_172802_c0_seq8.p1 gnl/TRDRNA2_/TRDRNA2_172802_c0~~gnl/TRDRNA2_/TRDRNA2_172802_c0_seq8.p1  ORF type:complete len:102 (-),score=32.94 gnl/TRDRNA2_/TRDRNA2_172802_c0_seq8:62-367(-)
MAQGEGMVKQSGHWQRMPQPDLDGVLGNCDALESSDDDADEPLLLEQISGPPTDETARKMVEHEVKVLAKIEKLTKRKQELRNMLGVYQKKEMEFVAQMVT